MDNLHLDETFPAQYQRRLTVVRAVALIPLAGHALALTAALCGIACGKSSDEPVVPYAAPIPAARDARSFPLESEEKNDLKVPSETVTPSMLKYLQRLIDQSRTLDRENEMLIGTINYNLSFNREAYARMREQRSVTDLACERLVLEKYFLIESLSVKQALRQAYRDSMRELLLLHDETRLRGGDDPNLNDRLKALQDEFDQAQRECSARLAKARHLLENDSDVIPARDLAIGDTDAYMEYSEPMNSASGG